MPSLSSIFKNSSIRFQKDFPESFIFWVTHQSTEFTLVYHILILINIFFCFDFCIVAEHFCNLFQNCTFEHWTASSRHGSRYILQSTLKLSAASSTVVHL